MQPGYVLAEGTVLGGDFVIARHLGSGGMGAVYIAHQTSTGKPRALKVMHGDIVPNASAQRRFEQEARVGAQIRSAHIVEVVAAGIDAATHLPYLVMELLEGVDLRTHMQARGPLGIAEVKAIFEQLCHGMGAAHAAGIVHRDLKPENIFLARVNQAGTTASVVKVLDFGIAKLAAESGTQMTAAIGSPLWMAPEQTAPGPVTPAADVWALGLIAFELLVGQHFWRAANVASSTPTHLLREIVLEPIPPASERGVGRIPPGFDEWFGRCLVRDPRGRFVDAAEAWAAMQYFMPAEGVPGGAQLANAGTAALASTVAAYVPSPSQATMQSAGAATPLAIAGAVSHPPMTVTAPRSSSTGMIIAIGIGVVGLLGGGLVAVLSLQPRASTSVLPTPTPAVAPAGTGGTVAPADTATGKAAPALRDGFADPDDGALETPHAQVTKVGVAHHVRILSRLVSNSGNVADDVVRSAVDWSSWEYLRCYTENFASAKVPPDGTVTVSFDILDQLPRHVARQSSTFSSAPMDDCIVKTLAGHTMNAARGAGVGHVVYSFKFIMS